MSEGRPIIPSPLYNEQLEEIASNWGGMEQINRALAGLLWALSRRPDVFDQIPDTRIRVAKTEHILWEGKFVPSLRVFFEIQDDGGVYLFWIEINTDYERPPGPLPPAL